MAKSVNRVFLLGNVGKDPEIRATGGGTTVATFSIATTERSKDPQGNWQDRTEWHNIVAYARLAEIIRDYVKKGSKLFVEGRMQTRNWDDQEFDGRRAAAAGRAERAARIGTSAPPPVRTISRNPLKSPTKIFRFKDRE